MHAAVKDLLNRVGGYVGKTGKREFGQAMKAKVLVPRLDRAVTVPANVREEKMAQRVSN
jgi:hypothetical protein